MADSQWRLFASLLRPHGRPLTLYGVTLAAATALPLVSSLALARFVRLAVGGGPRSALVTTGLVYALVGLAGSAVTVAVGWRANELAWRITDGLRQELAEAVFNADLSFHRDRTPGELVTRVDADVTAMTKFLADVVARVLAIVVLGCAAVFVLAVVEPSLAPLLAGGLGLVAFVATVQRDRATVATVAERVAEAEMMSVAEQYLAGAEDVAALGAGSYGVARLADRLNRLVEATGPRVDQQMRYQGTIRVALAAAGVAMIGGGALLASRGTVDVGAVVLGYRFVVVLQRPLEALTWRLQEAQGASGAGRRVLDLLREARQLPRGYGSLPPGPVDIRLSGIDLIYDDAEDNTAALAHVDLHVPAGRVLGVIGRTGSGKTSLARLILRLVAPSAGTVTFGGVDVAGLAETGFRRRVTAVPQDVQLFPGTVRDNVTLFADQPDTAVDAALAAVGLQGWRSGLPDGLDTVLAADGRDQEGVRVGLSAGQAQLIGVARALLRQPDVVVLDEATARVDLATQEAIAAALGELVRGRTAVVIAHRLETLDRCDDIAVLADGALVEFGTRVDLAADPNSRYAKLRAAGAAAAAEELA